MGRCGLAPEDAAPVQELARLLDLNDLYLTASTEEEKVPMTPELREELERSLREPRPSAHDSAIKEYFRRLTR